MNEPIDVAIVGGGISGLATAWWLRKNGHDAIVLEAAPEPGGTMRTVTDGDWLIETGPNSALETTPLFRTLFNDLGIANEVVYGSTVSTKRYILRRDRLFELPMSPGSFLKSGLWSVRGKARLLLEPFAGRAETEETIAQFVRRRLGREFLDYAINPFVAGVFAGDPERLSVRAAFPKLYALERDFGGLILGQVRGARQRKRRAEKAKDRANMFSFRRGMQTLPLAIAAKLGAAYRDRVPIRSITRADDRFRLGVEDGTAFDARAVVTAVPTVTTGKLLRHIDPSIAAALDTIPYPPVAEVFLGFRREHVAHPLDGFGFLVPELERRNILGALWSSSLFPSRAPDGHVALTVFVGGSRSPDLAGLPDDRLLDTVLEDLRPILGITAPPVYRRFARWDRAIPQYQIGHLEIVDRVRRLEEGVPGLFVAGNFIGGISVGDCVIQSEQTADRVARHLSQTSSSSFLKGTS